MGSLSPLLHRSSAASHRIFVPFCDRNAPEGDATTFIDCYTPATNTWHCVTSIPASAEGLVLKDFSMVAFGPHIYVLGGCLCRRPAEVGSAASVDGEFRPRAMSTVRRYDVAADRWEMCAEMSEARFSFACTVCGGGIYVAGGQSSPGRARGISSSEVYDPASDRWRSLANMSRMRYKCVGVTWKGRILVVGGFVGGENFGPLDQTARSSAEVYDAERDKWIYVARMWALDVPPRQIVVVNDKLFSSGDCLQPWKGHIESYDEKESIWNVVHRSHFNCMSPTYTAEGTTATGRCYITMAPLRNHLYFLTGYSMPGEGSLLRSEVHVFDTSNSGGGWRSLESIDEVGEKELCGHCCVLNDDE
ncbi:hypothetical protein SASPL_157896 [Salvia splendens]|uniref:Uncharacterized protein n=1 Tax=Salvia splendens TaxID=180675 RepID=A0A8X8VU66_SALSN|nr:F-box/kelch-repeat protein At1g16250-like [Salvia splendens]KAG6382435.1 hypothetical protein SASPL_157896 [Salvia splendens]